MDPSSSPTQQQPVSSILNPDNKKVKPHVTWDEAQLAGHDKTRGQKMKIDEPKTPYVTEEEFKKLCDEDPDYQRELGSGNQSPRSQNSVDKELQLANDNMKVNMAQFKPMPEEGSSQP